MKRNALGTSGALAGLLLSLALGATPNVGLAASGANHIVEYKIPSPGVPEVIAAGADGAYWFSERYTTQIGRVTSQGNFTIYSISSGNHLSAGITDGPDGALWFTFPNSTPPMSSGQIGRITTAGEVTLFAIPWTGDAESITTGPDGNLWFTDSVASALGRITTSGVVTKFPIQGPQGAYPYKVTAGPDDALWFTDFNGRRIGRLTTDGEVSVFPVGGQAGLPDAITSGPDGNLWFTLDQTGRVGRITTSGQMTQFRVPHPPGDYVFLGGITTGPDQALWFTYFDYTSTESKVGRISTSGAITMFATPTSNGGPQGIAAGPNSLWFTEAAVGKIGRLTIP